MNLNIVKDKKLFSWALYDWANSAYATIVLAGFYPIIFAENFASTEDIPKFKIFELIERLKKV